MTKYDLNLNFKKLKWIFICMFVRYTMQPTVIKNLGVFGIYQKIIGQKEFFFVVLQCIPQSVRYK